MSIATPGAGGARVAASVVLGGIAGFFAIFAGRPDYIFHVPAGVNQEAERAACVASYYEGHPDLAQEITGIVDRDFSKKAVFDDFVSYLGDRTSLKVVAVHDGSTVGDLTHEAVLRRARATGVDVLFELSQMQIDFDFDYGGKDCAIRPSVRLKYRVILVNRDQELAVGYAREKVYFPEETGLKAISRWLDDRGSLSKLIENGFKDAMPQIWYFNLPSR